MNHYPNPNPGEPWHQPSGETPGWGLPPEQHHGGAMEPYGAPTGGYHPMGQQPPAGGEAPLGAIGEIAFSQTTVITPVGRFPIRGTVWTVNDMSRTERTTPTWAVIVAILVFWWTCLLGLLFLLVKEQKTTGHVQVSVQGHDKHYTTSILVTHPGMVGQIHQQVNYARNLA
ncbi:hypothetical protein Q8791_16970 [Nocardiopsis sp. CT-R113]|uniref:Uncharacterized protein n=1 Tax=Nocardiopsis codii TaxID=3065942 RepID=A0ABU7K9L3_9ACTN|nr:hypothetical protein [Nocardiopsis sp. CT-R113]MEE2038915.1 hypothetical protein [Nocardiopsis sp. CT-R113]